MILEDAMAPKEPKAMRESVFTEMTAGGSRFKKGHPKVGGIKKGHKHFKTLFIEEMQSYAVDGNGRSVKNDLAITRKTVEMARQGNLQAIELIIERIDGKIPNVIAGSEENPLQIVVENVIAEKYSEQK